MNDKNKETKKVPGDKITKGNEKMTGKEAEKYCQMMMMRDLKRMDELRKEELRQKLNKIYPNIPHPRMHSTVSLEEQQKLEMETQQKSLLVEEKFGGLPLGYSGYPSVTPPAYKYYGLTECQQLKSYVPDYPAELHMHQSCVPRDTNLRQTVDNYQSYPIPNFTPPITFPTPRSSFGSMVSSIHSRHSMLVFFGKAPLTAPKEKPPIVSSSDAEAYNYLDYFNIDVLFEYFISLLLKKKPAEPYVYLKKLMRSLMAARKDKSIFGRLPRMFKKENIRNLFKMYDKFRKGTITLHQYKTAMESLGLYRYKPDPTGARANAISEDVFVQEAAEAINSLLRSFLILPQKLIDAAIVNKTPDYGHDDTVLTDAESVRSPVYASSTASPRARSASDHGSIASILSPLSSTNLNRK